MHHFRDALAVLGVVLGGLLAIGLVGTIRQRPAA